MDEMQDQAPETFHIGAPPAKPRKSKTGLLVAVAVLAFVTGGGAGALLTLALTGKLPSPSSAVAAVKPSPAESILSVAQRKCTPRESGVSLGDEGRSLTIQTDGDESTGISMTDLACLLNELKVTDAIISEIDTTRALDGRQTAEWGDLRASWTYHPDSGLRMVVTMS